MKKFILLILLFFVCSIAHAQCVAEVKDVVVDSQEGYLKVLTEYKLNGVVVDHTVTPCGNCVGILRYTEEDGTIQQIVQIAKAKIQRHCENLIKRNALNSIKQEKVNIQKAKTQPIVATLKANAVGWTKTLNEVVIQYKDKEITVNADGSYIITDAP